MKALIGRISHLQIKLIAELTGSLSVDFQDRLESKENHIMMHKERSGELLMVGFAFFESWFPIVTILTLQSITPIYAYTFTLVFSIVSFGSLLLLKHKLSELFNTAAYKDLIITSTLMIIMFSCIYIGLNYTSAGNMAVLIFQQFFFSFLYFNLIGKENFSGQHLIGALLMTSGAIIILFPQELSFNIGDILVLCAAALAPIANLFQKRARQRVSSETILAFRSITALPVLLLLAILFEPKPGWYNIQEALPWLAISGLFLMGLSKMLWVESIHRISITKASAMAALTPLFTLLFAYWTLNEVPDKQQLSGIIPVLLGGFFITRPPTAQLENSV